MVQVATCPLRLSPEGAPVAAIDSFIDDHVLEGLVKKKLTKLGNKVFEAKLNKLAVVYILLAEIGGSINRKDRFQAYGTKVEPMWHALHLPNLKDGNREAVQACCMLVNRGPNIMYQHGYPVLKLGGVPGPRVIKCARLACWFSHGMPPSEEENLSCHICSNKLCVNPIHLRWGSKSANKQTEIAHRLGSHKKKSK
jgi:hypothetical protein